MYNFKQAYEGIQEVKKKIEGLTFEEAEKELCAYYSDGELFDFNYFNIDGTVWNENGKAVLHENTCFDVFDTETNYEVFHGTEQEIKERI